MIKKILITGSRGMLAHDLIATLQTSYDLLLTDINQLDITIYHQVFSYFESHQPDLVINCAAYTQVDKAEGEGKELNYSVNALGVGNIAKACKHFSSSLIHISTDYVFDGTNKQGYLPDDSPSPLNAYGMAKWLGEEIAKQHLPDTIVVRTAWLYGGGVQFPNFVNTMLRLGKEKDELQIVNDQHGLPAYTLDLAHGIHLIIQKYSSYMGHTFHLTNAGDQAITWYDFAQEIFSLTGIDIKLDPCTTQEFPRPAPRPGWSELKNNSSIQLRHWKEGLNRYLSRI